MSSIPISGHTGLTCLLGKPVSHSVSPAMHNTAFEELGIDCRYFAFEVGEEELAAAAEGLRALGVVGFNLTMPLKNLMAEYCDELSDAAAIIGAVNTVVNDNGRFIGYTTDGVGYMMSVKDAGYDIIGKKMTLLGAGGAATSILVQAALDKVSAISVFLRPTSRYYDRAVSIAGELKARTDCDINLFDFNDKERLRAEIADSAILTNATSVGMADQADSCPVPDGSYLKEGLIVSDIIYEPAQTKLLKMAEDAGLPNFNGRYMLLFQGAEAFRLWTGKDMPVDIVKAKVFDV